MRSTAPKKIPPQSLRPSIALEQKAAKSILPLEVIKEATAKGLKYVLDSEPGIRRLRRGKSFYYVDAQGRKITAPATLERIRKLAIPPAYESVWICADERGHLQVTGIDARGRKQYRYHPKWRTTRDTHKFTKMSEFARKLPLLRRRLKHDLRLPGLPREKVLATVVSLLQDTLVRIGNTEYMRKNHSYGLTTLRDRHVKFLRQGRARLEFRGKSGKELAIELNDKRIASIVRRCHDLPGQHLFQYLDENGDRQPIDSGLVNDYLRETMGAASDGEGFTAKDFRTWGATLAAIVLLTKMPPPTKKRGLNHGIVSVCGKVSEALGNTPAICRKSYINPWVFEAWAQSVVPKGVKLPGSLREAEKYALKLLEMQRRFESSKRKAARLV